jgi:hypothetical protein
MATAVRVSSELIEKAKVKAKAFKRSAAGQIEYWAKIGEIAEENPNLPFVVIQDILVGLEEKKASHIKEYEVDGCDPA